MPPARRILPQPAISRPTPPRSAAIFGRANLSPATIKTYREAVDVFAGCLAEQGMPTDVAAISREHVEAFVTDQLGRWRPATAWLWLGKRGRLTDSGISQILRERGR